MKLLGSTIINPKPRPKPLSYPPWMQRNWGTLIIDHNMEAYILKQLLDDNVIAASDGSVLHGKAAHAHCLSTVIHSYCMCKLSVIVDMS